MKYIHTILILLFILPSLVNADEKPFLLQVHQSLSKQSWQTEALVFSKDHYNAAEYPFIATAIDYEKDPFAPVFRFYNDKPVVVGYIYYGMSIPVSKAVTKPGCTGGTWYKTTHQAYVCSKEGFSIGKTPQALHRRYTAPDITKGMQYPLYGKYEKNAPRLKRIPNSKEILELNSVAKGTFPQLDIVDKWLNDGTYFAGLTHKISLGAENIFYHTASDFYVREQDVKLIQAPKMYGEELGGQIQLPIAFVYEDTRPVYQVSKTQAYEIGKAEKHARFMIDDLIKHQGEYFIKSQHGYALQRNHVRIARQIERPQEIPAKSKWIHVNLAQQTLVAYEDNTPVFTTLVSSGKQGHETPEGIYKLERRYITKTMSGVDEDGIYDVVWVPWAMYYSGNYAIHGAYWHDIFGQTKSHGCTNIPPADARWLFNWMDNKLPEYWYAQFNQDDTYVYFTNTPVEEFIPLLLVQLQ